MMNFVKKALAQIDRWLAHRDWPLWMMVVIAVLVIIVLSAR